MGEGVGAREGDREGAREGARAGTGRVGTDGPGARTRE